MRILLFASFAIAAVSFICSAAMADLRVTQVEEATLPYDLSPSNYKNSPSNYENSISNYVNSSSNYENSESNYANSSANYQNSQNGRRRLVLKKGGSDYFVGYYAMAKNGTTNYFSERGKRIFFNPKGGDAVFCETDGEFCGVLALVNNKLSLALTQRGLKVLLLSE